MLAVGDPDLYVHHLEVLGRVTARLQRYGDIDELAAAYADWHPIVAPLTRHEGGEAVDVGSVAGAAWMVRYRELLGRRHRQQIASRIRDARRRGEAWITISESGPAPPSALSYPYERTMMRVTDGAVVRAFIDVDPETYGPVYQAEVLRADPETGVPLPASGPARRETFADRDAWQEGVTALQAHHDAGPSAATAPPPRAGARGGHAVQESDGATQIHSGEE
jgi:hypothetical protein